jgi:hypothetical protein
MASDPYTSIVRGSPLSWVYKKPLIISLSLPGPVPAKRWDAFINALNQADPEVVIGLGLGAVEINTSQRKEVSNILKAKRSVVVVDHPIARGITTALRWLGMPLRGFSWKEVPEAAKAINAPGLEPDEIVELIRRLCNEAIDPRVNGMEPPKV